jgi:formylglycine-generating enzyme required for sulfatase activity
MASRPIKMPEKDDSEKEPPDVRSQRKRPDEGRYLLQIDRQTKGSYQTKEEAQTAGMTIKKKHPVVQVSVYDRVESVNTLIQPPARAIG